MICKSFIYVFLLFWFLWDERTPKDQEEVQREIDSVLCHRDGSVELPLTDKESTPLTPSLVPTVRVPVDRTWVDGVHRGSRSPQLLVPSPGFRVESP